MSKWRIGVHTTRHGSDSYGFVQVESLNLIAANSEVKLLRVA